MIKIREATLKDTEQITKLWKGLMDYHKKLLKLKNRLKKNSEAIFKKFVIKNIKSKNSILIVAEEDKQLIGYLMGFIKDEPPIYNEDKIGYISDGFVIKEKRRKGVMKKLVNKAKPFFKKKKMKRVYLRADTSNTVGVRSWEKIGFKEKVKAMYIQL